MAISAALGSAALLPAGLGFRNVVINGNFDIWQRGTSFTTDNAATKIYTADRWCARALYPNSSAVQVITQDTSNVPSGSRYALKSVIGTAAVVNNSRMQLAYTIENADAVKLAGKAMALTLQAKGIQNIDRIAITPTYSTTGGNALEGTSISTTNFTVNTSSFTTCTLFFTMPEIGTLTTSGTLGFVISYTRSSGSAEQVGDGIYLSQVQLEQNYQPTPFEQRPSSVELLMCKRYFWRCIDPAGVGVNNSASQATRVLIPFHTEMRSAPTSTLSGTFNFWNGNTTGTGNAFIGVFNSRNHGQVDFNGGAGAHMGCVTLYTSGGSQYIDFASEIL